MTRPLGKTVWKLLDQAVRASGILPVERSRKQDTKAARMALSLGYLTLDEVTTAASRTCTVYWITPAGRTALAQWKAG